MSKDVSNMTPEELRIDWREEAKKIQEERQKAVDGLSSEQMEAIMNVRKHATSICEEALHGDGVRYIYCDQFNQLEESLLDLVNQFNLLGVSYD